MLLAATRMLGQRYSRSKVPELIQRLTFGKWAPWGLKGVGGSSSGAQDRIARPDRAHNARAMRVIHHHLCMSAVQRTFALGSRGTVSLW